MQIIYAVEQERTLRKPFGSQGLSLHDRGVSRMGILDDQYLGAMASDLIAMWPEFVELLAESGHTVQVLKSRAFAPAWAGVDDADLPPTLQALFAMIPRSRDGIPMLGSSAHVGCGLDSVVIVAPLEVALTAAKKRVQHACELAAKASMSLRLMPYLEATSSAPVNWE